MNTVKGSTVVVFAIAVLAASARSQAGPGPAGFAAEIELAKLAIAAHGGDKFANMKTLVVRGLVDVTTSASAQPFPASFVTIFSGDKYRIEIANPIQPLKQVYDGTGTSSSIRGGFTLPPINRLGLPLLQHLGRQGYIVTALGENKKKRRGFRMTSPEAYFTDFYVNGKTGQIAGYDSSYTINGRTVTTTVEIEKYRTVEGVLVPERYAQRFDTEQITIYATFKAKEILVNSEVPESYFKLAE